MQIVHAVVFDVNSFPTVQKLHNVGVFVDLYWPEIQAVHVPSSAVEPVKIVEFVVDALVNSCPIGHVEMVMSRQ